MIMTASLSGLLTGEWKYSTGRSRVFLAAGMMFLLAATLLLTTANRH
jgi:hypothetical protein